jgi:hypothetical protein
VVQSCQSRFTFSAADGASAAAALSAFPPKTRVQSFHRLLSGRLARRGRCRSINTPGSRGYAYKTVSGRHEWPSRDPNQERGGLNLYGYVGNNPVNFYDPYGLIGWGVVGGVSGTLGFGPGWSGTASAGVGFFFGPNSNGTPASLGGYTSSGLSMPDSYGNIGAAAGAGGGFFITDADNANCLKQTITTAVLNIGFGIDISISFSWGNGVHILEVTTGPGGGIGLSVLPTTTTGGTLHQASNNYAPIP